MKPKTRLEWFLAKIAGDADATGTVTPKTRKEFYLKEIADNGGGGGSSDPYPGYDVVVSFPDFGTISPVTILKGNYTDAYENLSTGKPVAIAVMSYYGDEPYQIWTGSKKASENGDIVFAAYWQEPTDNIGVGGHRFTFTWNENGITCAD